MVLFIGCTNNSHRDVSTENSNNDKKTEMTKQPNCNDIEGFQVINFDSIPYYYSGAAFNCFDYKVHSLYNYKKGKKEGVCRSWYKNGQMSEEYNYKDGVEDGLCRSWYENGQINYEYNYKDDVLISERCWDEEGNLTNCIQGCSH